MSEKMMLCESITKKEVPNLNGNFKANIKYDGERIMAIKQGEDFFLMNRRGKEKSFVYPEITEELKKIPCDFILDGEVITTDGVFNTLQHRSGLMNRQKIKERLLTHPVIFMAFDILKIKDRKLQNEPLNKRVEILESFIDYTQFKRIGFVKYEEIEPCLAYAEEHKLEGIIVKDMESIYEFKRSWAWMKLKLFKEEIIRVIRYTENNAGIRLEDKELNAVQCSGEQHKAVKKQIDEFGFCEINIQYLEKTDAGRFRMPSFKEMVRNVQR